MDADIGMHAKPANTPPPPKKNTLLQQGSEPTAFKGLTNYCKYSEVVYKRTVNHLTEQLQ